MTRFDKSLLRIARRMFHAVFVDIDRGTHFEGRCDTEVFNVGDRVRIYPTAWEYEEAEIIHSNDELAAFIREYGESII